MKIDTKYEIGQPLWIACRRDTQILVDCPICNGSRKVLVKGYGKVDCPECGNSMRSDGKKVERIEKEWYVNGTIVTNCITIQLLQQRGGIRYKIHYDGHPEDHLHATEYEAEDWCKEANEDPCTVERWLGKDVFLTPTKE
jgi:hypothetical protein